MDATTGILFALVALFGWGIGDFMIQRTTRLVGSAKALFFIGFVAFVVLTPFVVPSLELLDFKDLTLLLVLSLVVMSASAFDFEALRTGKIAVVEPIVGLELPIAVGVSLVLINESIPPLFLFIITFIVLGTLLTVLKNLKPQRVNVLERGVLLALIAAVGTAISTVLVGVTSQDVSPLVAIWFSHVALMIVSGVVVHMTDGLRTVFPDIKKYPVTVGAQSVADNVAWLAFGMATTHIPIAIATAISGGYVAMAVCLGIFLNRERLRTHQVLGIAFVSFGIILISYFFDK